MRSARPVLLLAGYLLALPTGLQSFPFNLALPAAVAQVASPSARESRDSVRTGFEQLKPGPLLTQRDHSGEWSAAEGHATVHTQHQRSGKHSLRLLGGRERQIVWTPVKPSARVDQLEFWYERWTKRMPYEFRVEALVNGEWKTLHHDTKSAIVGSFRNYLSLNPGAVMPDRFRFTSTTPDNSGVMIDDLRLTRAIPMRVVSVTATQLTLPVLVRNERNSVLEILIETEGNLKPLRCEQFQLAQETSTASGDIAHIEVLNDVGSRFTPFGEKAKPADRMMFSGNRLLTAGKNRFLVSVQLRDNARQTGRIQLSCRAVEVSSQTLRPRVRPLSAAGQRIGYAVRKSGDDGSHTYRIPGLATTKRGTLIGVYDVRRRSGGDLPGDIDVGMSRSTDGGRSWEPMRVIMDMGDEAKWHYDGIGDPAVLVDRQTGTIWVAATWSHGNRSWRGSGPGLAPEETGQLMLVRSDDDGLSWSKPINITGQVKKPEWCFLLQGPGKGITMRDGTIVFAAQFQDTPENRRLPRSTIIYSKDHGESWKIGTGAFDDTTEAQVVEIEPGVLMLNCRYNRESKRVVMTTRDMGRTWQEHSTSRRDLIEPRACMASLINVDQELGKDVGGWLLFSNPDSLTGRDHITIKASPDGGRSWPEENRLLLDEGRSAGYSCMTMIDEQTIGILYEGSQAHMTFQRIPLADVTGPAGLPKRPVSAKPAERPLEPPRKRGDPRAGNAGSSGVPRSPGVSSRPNVLLIVSEDNGAELGCYGDPFAVTPALDQLAAEGCRFANAYVTQAVCSVSRASFLTGLYPFQNGQIGLATHRYAMFRKWDNMPSLLKELGYRTGMIGKLHVNPESAFPLDYRAIAASGFNDRPMKKYAAAAETFFRETDQPFFLAVNFPDAHFPLLRQQYGLPVDPLNAEDVKPMPFIGADSPRLRQGAADYYNCLSRLDTGIGLVLTALSETGKAGNTLVIYIGDHGAQFSRGKATCYEGGLRIPMILRWPGQVKPGTVREELVSTIDLLPTVLEAVSLPARSSLPGRSLLPLAAGREIPWRTHLFAERTAYSAPNFFPQRTVRDARYKLILNLMPERSNPVPDNYLNQRGSFFLYGTSQAELDAGPKHIADAYQLWRSPPAVELYDLQADPWEFRNQSENPKLADVKARLLAELKAFREKHSDPLLNADKLKRLAEEHDHVAKHLKNGRYGAGQSWKYQTYLR